MNTETLEFSMYLTGHDEETIKQIWSDWKQGTKKYHCENCTHYTSYRDDCFGDPLEPDEQGYCKGNPKKDNHTFGEYKACEFFKQ